MTPIEEIDLTKPDMPRDLPASPGVNNAIVETKEIKYHRNKYIQLAVAMMLFLATIMMIKIYLFPTKSPLINNGQFPIDAIVGEEAKSKLQNKSR